MTEGPAGTSVTVILMGVTGVGKSSVMAPLARRLGAKSAEGDAFHSASNVSKMRAGVPLTDEDRSPWLTAIADWIGARESESVDAVVTCSALRRRYRDLLRAGHPSVRFVHLTASPAILERRVAARTGHYMPPSLLPSQLETLEPLSSDEPGFELVADRAPSTLADEIAERLGRP
jgi:gluconokinase